MAINVLYSAKLATATNTVIGVNKNKASCSFLFKLNTPVPLTSADYFNAYMVTRSGGQGLLCSAASIDQTAQTMSYTLAWRASNNIAPVYRPTIVPGIVYSFVLTYDKDNPSDQAVYVNGVKYQMAPTQSLPLDTDTTALEIGITYTGTPLVRDYVVDNLMFWNDYIVQPSEVAQLMHKTGDPTTIGTSATWRDWWKLDGTPGAVPVAGDNALKGSITNDYPFTPTITGSVAGSNLKYVAPLVFVSQATYDTPVIGSSGKTVRVLTKSAQGSDLTVTAIGATKPTIKINGGSPVTLTRVLSTSHCGALFYIDGTSVAPGDSVTFSAVDGFLETGLGSLTGATDLPCINKSGRPVYEDNTRQLAAGFNYTYPASADWGGYQGPRNWALRLKINTATETTSTIRADGTLKVNRLNIPLVTTNAATGIDYLDYPMPTGKWVVSFIPKDAGRATDIVLTSNTPGACTELTDYRNNGSVAGDRVIKVFNLDSGADYANTLGAAVTSTSQTSITLTSGTNLAGLSSIGNPTLWLKIGSEVMDIIAWNSGTKVATVIRGTQGTAPSTYSNGTACITRYYSQNPQMRVHITGPGGVPNYSDVVIYCPDDWTPPATPVPVTDLDTSTSAQLAPTEFVRESMVDSGVSRYMDSGGAFTQMTEPEHMRQESDLYWGQDPKYVRDFRFTNIRAFNPANTPYIYWHFPFTGSQTYSATLSVAISTAPASGTVETITISDAATAPVLQGSKLFIGSEQMRVLSVNGTAVTVARGTMGTTTATHSTGTITVGWRLPVTDAAQYQFLGSVAVDMQTDQTHGLYSGMWNGDPADLDMNPYARFNITLTSDLAAGATSTAFTISADSGDWPKIVRGLYIKLGTDVMRILDSNSVTGAITVETGPANAHSSGESGTTMCTGMLCKSLDGTKSAWSPKSPTSIYFYVLGADRVLVNRFINLPNDVAVVDGDQSWDQTPKIVNGSDNSQLHWQLPISLYPLSWTARLTALSPNSYHWLNIPAVASDEWVYEAAVQIRDNLPVGNHKVIVELANETWNFFFPFYNLLPCMSALARYGVDNRWDWWVARTKDVVTIIRNVFNATGRAAEVLLSLPSQMGLIDRPLLRAEILGVNVDVASTAPYFSPDYTDTIKNAFNASDDGQCVDTWTFDFETNMTRGAGANIRSDAVKLAAYKTRTGLSTKWIAYEGGVSTVLPNPTNGISDPTIYTNGIARNLDLCNNPTMYCAHTDFLSIEQMRGMDGQCFFDHMQWPQPTKHGTGTYHEMWGTTCYHGQPGGRGDGSDSKADNRQALARPGQPGTKAPLANYGLSNVAVRLQSVLDWNNPPVPPENVDVPHGIVVPILTRRRKTRLPSLFHIAKENAVIPPTPPTSAVIGRRVVVHRLLIS